MDRPPDEPNLKFCPTCEEVRASSDFDFLGLVPEVGNLPRYRCHRCGSVFEQLPPSFILPEIPERSGPHALRLKACGPDRGAVSHLFRITTGATAKESLEMLRNVDGQLATGPWFMMYELGKRYEAAGAVVEIVKLG
jgi:hypothetical protein